MQCRTCKGPLQLSPFRAESQRRFRQFAVFAAALLLIAAFLYVAGVAMWPWWLAGMGLFVLSQGLLKWHDSRRVFCHHCQDGYTVYGRF